MRDKQSFISNQPWRGVDPKEIWAYRSLALTLTIRDIKVRYKQSILGFAWAFVRPIATLAVFTFVFSNVAGISSDGYPYALYLYAALLPWNLFANSVQRASASLVSDAPLVSKIYFPRLIIPLSSLGAILVDSLIGATFLVVLLLYYDVALTWSLLLLPLVFVVTSLVALSISLGLAAMAVSFRDVIQAVPFFVQLLMFMTPVVYPASSVPEKWLWLFELNPMAAVVDLSRSIILGLPINTELMLTGFAVTTVFMAISLLYFARAEHRFADVI